MPITTKPCPCECNRGGCCGGCGHTGCGGRSRCLGYEDEFVYEGPVEPADDDK